jgi:spore maturation protein CgeB
MLGCDQSFELEGYFSNRTWITLGCGGFLLTNYNPGLEKIFTKGEHLEWYHNQEECLELIEYYLKHEDRRKQIAQNGYQFAHTQRTYDTVIDEIISHIESSHNSG